MPLQSGHTLLHYCLLEKIGEGGMGVVWKAKDTILDREVAIKVLPDAFAKDPDRLARFQREAKLLAALNHSNIAAIYGLEEANGQRFLVLELVEGETLTARLSHGALPTKDALSLALQIAKALEAAHEKEIIHRDLKPANVKITSDGKVKVLDFGLAKVLESTSEGDASEYSQTRTLTQISTQGALLGTPGYMSPEQVEGLSADKRSDIWSFGCLLYESLTGTAAFNGKTVGERVAATLAKKPNFSALPSGTPLEIIRLLRRCLRRERARRIHSIADVRIEIEDALEDGTQERSAYVEENLEVQPLSPIEKTFRLTAQLCRKLDRTTLDPRVIGDDMHYTDNERSSDVLVFYLPGLGLDHRIFEETLALSPFRGLALTFYGCEPASRHRIVMTMADQLVVLRQFLANTIEHLAPKIVILAGFSLGADAAFRLLSETEIEPSQVDGILSLSCNLSLDTCVFSARLAEVASATTEEMLPALQAMGRSVSTLDEWVQVHRYLVELVSKFRLDFGVLRSAAKAVMEPFAEPTRQPFAKWYRSATEQGTSVRCVFTDTEIEQDELRRIKLKHLDGCSLGTSFNDDDLFTEIGKNHFDLLDTKIIRTHLDWLVHRIRQKQRG